MPVALYDRDRNEVVTFLRDDLPDSYVAPDGFELIDEAELPDGWTRVTSEPVPTIWSPREFMKRFTPQELVAIHTAARTDAQVAILLSNALADDVHSDSEELSQGLDYLVSQTLLTADRKTAIITP